MRWPDCSRQSCKIPRRRLDGVARRLTAKVEGREDCYRLFLVEPALPQSEGWQTPPAAVIPVQLSGLNDADWALEEDERGF